MSTTPAPTLARAACIDHAELFQNELLENPPTRRDGPVAQAAHRLLTARAATVCGSCPLLQKCLYDAVVTHDVSGFVAGTSEAQRTEIRLRLGVRVEKEDLDTLTGLARTHRQLDSQAVLRLRAANPHESLEVIAMRLGCSLSTVKRHMRRAKTEQPRPSFGTPRPDPERVFRAAAEVTGGRRRSDVARVA